MYKQYVRPLTKSESRYLQLECARRKNLALKELAPKSIMIALGVGLLAGIGFGIFANYYWYWGALLGAFAAFLLKVLAGFDYHKSHSNFSSLSKKADETKVTRIESSRIIELKEFEDLGVTYCFEIEPNKFFILSGQDYYETQRFPCLNFEIIEIEKLLYTIRPKSIKLLPDRVIPECISKEIKFYETEVIVDGTFENIEDSLKAFSE